MTAKEYLSQVRFIDSLVDSKLEQLARLKETATKATMTISDMPRSDSPDLQSMESTIVKMIDMEREINADIDRLVDLKREAQGVVDQLPDMDQRLILELRYFGFKKWPEITEELGYSEATIYRLHGVALKNITRPSEIESK